MVRLRVQYKTFSFGNLMLDIKDTRIRVLHLFMSLSLLLNVKRIGYTHG